MKKLMIAAAVAAMIGGAFATTYDVTASLKTTVGKYGQAKKTTTTYYLGADAVKNGNMWYDEQAIQAAIDADKQAADTAKAAKTSYARLFGEKTYGGKTAYYLTSAGLKDDVTKALLAQYATTDKTGKNDVTHEDGKYDCKSAGKWCQTFSITVQPDGICYRVAGTITAKGTIVDDCCLAAAAPELLNVFGAASYATCTKAELYMTGAENLFDISVIDSTKDARTLTALTIAGQGSFGNVITAKNGNAYTTERGVTAISGYAVGKASAALCTHCCVSAINVTTWDCAQNVLPDGNDDTAVYGTFTIKYNATKTKAEF